MPEQRELIRQLLSGNITAEVAFVREWGPRVMGWVRRRVPEGRVDDYVQEVLAHLCDSGWSCIANWDGLYTEAAPQPNSLAGYLKRITDNKVTDLLRADGRSLPDGGDGDAQDAIESAHDSPEAEAARAMQLARLQACIAELPGRDRDLLHLWRQGHSDRYTASLLAMTENNVRQRRHYLISKLRDRVAAPQPET